MLLPLCLAERRFLVTKRLESFCFTAEKLREGVNEGAACRSAAAVESAEAAAALFLRSSPSSRHSTSQPPLTTSPKKKNSSCVTCGLPGAACAGHFGHIELAVPVYNPLVFG